VKLTRAQQDELLSLVSSGFDSAMSDLASAVEGDFAAQTNVLSEITSRVTLHLRRKILLAYLEAHRWNLTAVSDALGLGGAGNVTKQIIAAGLVSSLQAARGAGKAHRGRRRGPQTTVRERAARP